MFNGKHVYVCVPCRRVSRAGSFGNGSWTCPTCDQPMRHMDYRWRAPKRTNTAGWRRIEAGEWLWDRRAVRRKTFRPETPGFGIPWFERAPRDARGRPAKHRPRES